MWNKLLLAQSIKPLIRTFSGKKPVKVSTMSTLFDVERYAYVNMNEQSKRLTVSFMLKTDYMDSRFFKIDRNPNECIDISLKRLRMNIETIAKKKWSKKIDKLKKEGGPPPPDLSIDVFLQDSSGKTIEAHALNKEAFIDGNTLHVDTVRFPIIVNAPTIDLISSFKEILKGFPVVPKLEVSNVSDINRCHFSWWRSTKRDYLPKTTSTEISDLYLEYGKVLWTRIEGEDRIFYEPTDEDVGKRLLVICEPREKNKKGVPVGAIISEVQSFDFDLPAREREKSTSTVLDDSQIRVVSYNILAGVYSTTPAARNELFSYCRRKYLDFEYRRNLLNKEILGFNADIMCLQEVDNSMFKRHLKPLLDLQGLSGIFSEKGDSKEGETIFFRRSKFEYVKEFVSSVLAVIRDEESHSDIWEIVKSNPNLQKKLSDITTIIQIAVLKHKESDRYFVVCNTHLYFHPTADFVRMIQAWSCLRLAESLVAKYSAEGHKVSTIFCGDFNSTPDFAVYKLFTTGKVPKDDPEFTEECTEVVRGINVSISNPLASACGTPEYTNYTTLFNGCLDYIFHSKDLKVDSVVPMPDHSLVQHPEHKALPSPLFPSDHLPLIATLSLAS